MYKQMFSDVNITYGAWFFEDHGDYADVIQVRDHNDDGLAVYVTNGSISLLEVDRVRKALEFTDMSVHRAMDREQRRYNIWYALCAYWGIDSNEDTIVQFAEGEAVKRVEYFVFGEQGLRDWLDERYDIEWE